jgi:hypothetical protein
MTSEWIKLTSQDGEDIHVNLVSETPEEILEKLSDGKRAHRT